MKSSIFFEFICWLSSLTLHPGHFHNSQTAITSPLRNFPLYLKSFTFLRHLRLVSSLEPLYPREYSTHQEKHWKQTTSKPLNLLLHFYPSPRSAEVLLNSCGWNVGGMIRVKMMVLKMMIFTCICNFIIVPANEAPYWNLWLDNKKKYVLKMSDFE